MNFIAMDFETANRSASSACSIALVMVRDNKVIDEYYTLINPEEQFEYRNVQVHGIHPEDVHAAPKFYEIWPDMSSLFSPHSLVVAHNARFDIRVLQAMLDKYGIPRPNFLALDTLKTSRKFHPDLPNHRLNTVSEALQIDLAHHHHALSDSLACAKILIHDDENFGEEPIKKLVQLIN